MKNKMKARFKLLLLLYLLISASKIKSQSIQQIGYYNVNGVTALSSKSGYMVLGTGAVVSLANPTLPSFSGNISLSSIGSSVLVSGNYAYFGTAMNVNLIIAEITNPNFPLQVGIKSFPAASNGIFGMVKNDNVVYLAMGTDGVYSVDVSNPPIPVVIDSMAIAGGQARDIVQYANVAFVAHSSGLKILNINDPSNINLISSIGSGYTSIDIDTLNNYVFLGKDAGGIDVFNISNPQTPVPLFSIPNPNGTAWDIKYGDGLLYLATNNSGLFIYKVLGASATQMANFPNTSNGQSFAVALQDSLILLSGLINGVAILQYDSLGTNGVNDEIQNNEIILYPNPAGDYLEIAKNIEPFTEFEIINPLGQCILKNTFDNESKRIDLSFLQNGNYHILLKNKSSISKRGFIKLN